MNLGRLLKRLWLNVIFELKGMRLYWMQIVSSLFIMPQALLFINLMANKADSNQLAYSLSGFIVASMVGSLIGCLSLRVCNMMLPEVLELYTTYSLGKPELVLSLSITYGLLSLPQIIVAVGITVIFVQIPHLVLYLLTILLSMTFLALFASGLGLVVKNYYQAMGLFPLLSYALVLLSPAYVAQTSGGFLNFLFLLNPLTHLLNLIRSGLGLIPTINTGWSWAYLGILTVAILLFERRKLKNFYILEKY